MNESWHGIRNLGQSKLSMYDNCLNGRKKNDACCVCWLVGCCSGGGSCSSIKWISLNGWRRLSATRLCWFAWLAGWLADWRKSKSFVIWIWNGTVGGIDQTGRSITQRTTLVLTERLGEERTKIEGERNGTEKIFRA